jgi:hypothetical protein
LYGQRQEHVEVADDSFIGKVISLHFSDRKEPICGQVIAVDDDWTLMRHIVVDYALDGFVVVRHRNIKHYKRGESELFKEKVLRLKAMADLPKDPIKIDGLQSILAEITERFGIFEIQTKRESACYLGRLVSFSKKRFTIESIDTNGQWDGQMKFTSDKIRIIRFETDYAKSLLLVANS